MKKKLLVYARPDTKQLTALGSLANSFDIEFTEVAKAASAEALLLWESDKKVARDLIAANVDLKWVHSPWAGVEGILFPELVEKEIVLTNARGVFAESLAEFAITGMLYFAKDIPKLQEQRRAGSWKKYEVECLKGARLGVVGYGGIGQAIGERATVFGMEVVGFRSSPKSGGAENVFGIDRLDDLLGTFDYLALSLPNTAETKKLLSKERLKHLKDSAVVINVGRGSTIDEAALIEMLQSKKLRGAALDVFEVEPLPSESPFWKLENVLLSPHTADRTVSWLDETTAFFIDNARRFAGGEELQNVVDKRRGY